MNVESILNKLNIPYKTIKGGRELQFRCICPNHNDRHASACISTESGLWHCFSCGESGNLRSFVRIAGGDGIDVRNFITQTDDLKMRMSRIYRESAKNILRYENDLKFEEQFRVECVDNFVDAFTNKLSYNYLCKKRKLTLETIQKFNLMYSVSGQYSKRVIIPYYENGDIIGFNSRYIGECESSYRYRYNINHCRFDSYLYNFDNIDNYEYCILVEGPFDLMYMVQCGFKNVISTLNTRVSLGHIKKLIKFKKIIFCFDNDVETKAGQNAVMKHASEILSLCPSANLYMVKLPEGKDPNECTSEELHESFRHIHRIKIDNDVSNA